MKLIEIKKQLKKTVKGSAFFVTFCRYFKGNKFHISSGNVFDFKKTIFKKCIIDIKKTGNTLIIKGGSMQYSHIVIFGSDNIIEIGENCIFNNATLWIEDSGSKIKIGKECKFTGKISISACEGNAVNIGDDCLFSSDIHITNTDSHTILNNETGKRINPAQDISIGSHVWIGTRCTVLKGSKIPNNSIIGACSLVNRKFEKQNCIIAGNPARVVKENINWDSITIVR